MVSDFPSVGDTLRERYVVRRLIGRGGMGAVLLAWDGYAQREVAVKLTSLEAFEDSETGQRMRKLWLNETRLAGMLKHPHIVEIYEAGSMPQHAYLVMEFVDGESLARYASPQQLLPVETVADVLFKVANALDYAHSLGMLHRDIKPANVLRGAKGEVKLTDFGACYMTDVEQTQVQDVGTLPFMPPEHFKGRAPTAQTDIYALGVMAYQLLTGRWPFVSETFQGLIAEKLEGSMVPLEARRKDLPNGLRFAVHRAMHRDTEVRYASWREFSDDLADALPDVERPREIAFESGRFASLRAMPLFARFSDTELWETVHMSRWIEKRDGEQIFAEGDPGDRIFVIAEGAVAIRRSGETLNTLAAGECFGEVSYLDEEQSLRTAAACAAGRTELVEIETESLRKGTDAVQAAFLKAFAAVLAKRLKQADARFFRSITRA